MTAAVPGYPIRLKDSPIVYRGAAFDWTLQMGDDGATVDLTGYGATWAATLRPVDKMLDTIGFDFDIDTTHLADGYIILSLTGDQTLGMRAAEFGFDVIATGGAISPFPVWAGAVFTDGSYTIR